MAASPYDPRTAPAQRFNAKAGASGGTWLAVIGGPLLFGGGLGLAGQLAVPERMSSLVPVVIILSALGYAAGLVLALRGRDVPLEITAGRVTVDEGRGGAFAIGGAWLSPWREPYTGTISGTALCVQDGGRLLRIGGRDHRPDPSLRLTVETVDVIDMYLPAADFDDLLRAVLVASPARPAAAAQPAGAGALVRCALVPNPGAASSRALSLVPFIAAIVLAGLIGAGGAASGAGGLLIAASLAAAVILIGLGLSVWLAMRRAPLAALEIDAAEVRLCDPATGALLAASPRRAIPVALGTCRVELHSGPLEYPLILLPLPGRPDLSVGVEDLRFSWAQGAVAAPRARYLVGPPDWLALTEALGVRGLLRVAG